MNGFKPLYPFNRNMTNSAWVEQKCQLYYFKQRL